MDPTLLKGAIDTLEKVGILQKVMLKLISNPEVARQKLRAALLEIRKTTEAISDALTEIVLLSFDADDLDDTRKQLRKIAEGRIQVDFQEATGSCRRIKHIYKTYLNGWFSKFLNPPEANELARCSIGYPIWTIKCLRSRAGFQRS